MFNFLKARPTGASAHVAFLTEKISRLENRLHRRVPMEEHAVDHLCDFVAAVANIHPLGPASRAAMDLRIIAEAIRAQAQRSHDSDVAKGIHEVFSRYHDYRDEEITLENLFELSEWILEGAMRQGDGDYDGKAEHR